MRFKSFKEYILYLYVHIAYADGSIHPLEKDLILDRMKHLFPGQDKEQLFNDMVERYLQDAAESHQIIVEAHEQFRNVEFYKKYKVFLDLYEIINADGVIHESETEALDRLKDVIGIEISHNEDEG